MPAKFIAVWGKSFSNIEDLGHAEVRNVDQDFFSEMCGYDPTDIDSIYALEIGESWVSKEYSDHTVVRII